MADCNEIARYCDSLLAADSIDDYCPNGLQVAGGRPIARLVTGVTASLALIDAAADAGADALLVHHGWFWKGDDPRLVGMHGRRVMAMVGAGMALLAYHLPLDVHRQYGNNRRLGERLGLEDMQAASDDGLIWSGALPTPRSAADFLALVGERLARRPLHIPVISRPVKRIAWCTGAAQRFIDRAAALDVDLYLSGEISEQTAHQARELGLDYAAAGHHATERYGVQALGAHLAERFGLQHSFIDIDNPA